MASSLKPSFVASRIATLPSEAQKKAFASAYRDVVSLSLPSGLVVESSGCVTVSYSQRDLAQNAYRKFTNTFQHCPTSKKFHPTRFMTEIQGIVGSFPSPSGNFTAVLRAVEKKSNLSSSPGASVPLAIGKTFIVDIYSKNQLLFSVPTQNHGKIYTGPPFGTLTWSLEEDCLVYAAECLPLPRESFFKGLEYGEYKPNESVLKDAKTNGMRADDLTGTESDYQASWGEQMNEAKMVSLFLLHLPSRHVMPVPGIPPAEVLSAGQPVFAYGSDSGRGNTGARGIVFTGFPVEPRRLGLIFYNSRPQSLFYVGLPNVGRLHDDVFWDMRAKSLGSLAFPVDTTTSKTICLTPHLRSACFPRFTPDFKTLVFLSSNLEDDTADAPHCTTSTLSHFQWPKDLSSFTTNTEVVSMISPQFPLHVGCLWKKSAAEAAFSGQITHVVPVPMGYKSVDQFPGLYTAEDYPLIGTSASTGALSVAPGVVVLNSQMRSVEHVFFSALSGQGTGTGTGDDDDKNAKRAVLGKLVVPTLDQYLASRKDITGDISPSSAEHQTVAKLLQSSSTLPTHSVPSAIALAAGEGYIFVALSQTHVPPALFRVDISKDVLCGKPSYTVSNNATTNESIPLNDVVGKWTFVTSLEVDVDQEDNGLRNSQNSLLQAMKGWNISLEKCTLTSSPFAPVTPMDVLKNFSTIENHTLLSSFTPEGHDEAFSYDTLVTFDRTKFSNALNVNGAQDGTTNHMLRGIVLFPHGGPHSAFNTCYDFVTSLFASLGLAVVRVNYRGSVGYGQTAMMSLPPKCGRQDIDDCMASLQQTVEFLGETLKIEAETLHTLPVFLFGGSHGGYIVTHLTGQFPNTFAACVARNPVVNMPFTVFTSDIPDWCYVESGQKFSNDYIVTDDVLKTLYDASPIAYASKIVTPTMLHIGTNDQRVPPAQSYDFYKMLQMRGVPSRLITYKDAQHGLNDTPLIHADSTVNSISWFATFGGLKK